LLDKEYRDTAFLNPVQRTSFVSLATKRLKTETGGKLFQHKLLEKETNHRIMRLGKIRELFLNCTPPELFLSFLGVTNVFTETSCVPFHTSVKPNFSKLWQ